MEDNKSEKRLLLSEIKSRAIDQEGSEAAALIALINHLRTGRLHAKLLSAKNEDGSEVVPETLTDIDWVTCSVDWDGNSVSVEATYHYKNRVPSRFTEQGTVTLHEVQFLASEAEQIWPAKSVKGSKVNDAPYVQPSEISNWINKSQPVVKLTEAQHKEAAEKRFGRKLQTHNIWRKVWPDVDGNRKLKPGQKMADHFKSLK